MNRAAVFFANLVAVVLLNTLVSNIQSSPADQPQEISCRFLGLENLFNDTEVIALRISGNTAEIRVDDEKKDIPVRKTTSRKLESLKRSIRQNLLIFENGKKLL